MQYWLMKSEPDVFSIDDLAKKKDVPLGWRAQLSGAKLYAERNATE